MKKMILFFAAAFLSTSVYANVEVAFFEYRTSSGQVISVEPGGQFYHVAVRYQNSRYRNSRYQNGWLHAHPFYGVVLEPDIHKVGQLVSVLSLDQNLSDHQLEQIEKEIGKKFSMSDDWSDSTSTYCSKLVANILNIKPTLMKNGQGWGISPDDLYHELKAQHFSEKKSCEKLF